MTLIDFINAPRGLMVAAAGHGKTHTIAECVQLCPYGQCQLVLTHTHAGIASIKAKLVELKVDAKKYHVETISSFAQQFVLAYRKTDDLPETGDKDYFPLVLSKAAKLFANPHILDVIRLSYAGLFVDEYQDCTAEQHKLIMQLGQVLPIHVLGDSLQGIFGFAGRLVDFEQDLPDFAKFDLLEKPWRWHKAGNCKALGDKILEWRRTLLTDNKIIRLESCSEAHIEVIESQLEAQDNNQEYFSQLRDITLDKDCESLLILFPMYHDELGKFKGKIDDRVRYKSRFDFENKFLLVEAIDAKEFYSNAKNIDELIQKISNPRIRLKEKKIYDFVEALTFKKSGGTGLDDWFDKNNGYRIKNKLGNNRAKAERIRLLIQAFTEHPCKRWVLELLDFLQKEIGMKPKRREIVTSIQYCLRNYPDETTSVYDSMKEMRNAVRRYGRKIQGRCIGTTLLTKGLEFDTVIVADAHRFAEPKNFYVAVSRACKNLIIITKETNLEFLG